MKVSELIEQLQQYDGDLPVYLGYMEIEGIHLNEEHFFGDSANPNPTGKAVEIE